MPVSPPGHSSTTARSDAAALLRDARADEARLAAFGRRADRELRRAFVGPALAHLLSLRTAPTRGTWSRLRWLPSSRVVALAGLAIALPLATVMLPMGFAAIGVESLSPLPTAVHRGLLLVAWLAAGLAVVVWGIERWLLPRLALTAYRFQLLKLERESADGEHPALYRGCGMDDAPDGFGWQQWRRLPSVAPGDLVAAVVDRRGEAVATILPRLSGHSPLMLWRSGLWVPDALPAAPRLRELVVAFDRACAEHDALLRLRERIDAGARLRSGSASRSTSNDGDRETHGADAEAPRSRADAAWRDLVLPAEALATLQQAAEAIASGDALAPRGVLLHGPPGTGKSLAARALGEAAGCTFFALSPADLKAAHLGGGAQRVRELWLKARQVPRAVIFVDECDALFARRGGLDSDVLTEEIVAAFLAAWDGIDKGGRVTVVGATNRRDRLDPAILSRFELDLAIGLPGAVERRRLLGTELARHALTLADPDRAAVDTSGLSGRELARARKPESPTAIGAAAVEAAVHTLRRRSGAPASPTHGATSRAGWERLVLAEPVLRELKAMAGLLRHAAAFRARGIESPRGLLLCGPPGTGKTQIARTLAQDSGLAFIGLTTADLKQGYVGQSGQKVREVFQRAREAAPCVLFIDEIDALGASRDAAQDAFQMEITGQLLQEMDGIGSSAAPVFVLAATNRREALDAALRSRFPRELHVGLPDAPARETLLRILLEGKPLAFALDAHVGKWAARSEGMSGRDLRSWIEAAELAAVGRAMDEGRPEAVALRPDDFDAR